MSHNDTHFCPIEGAYVGTLTCSAHERPKQTWRYTYTDFCTDRWTYL